MSSLLSPGVLGPVSVMATPPKLKTPARSRKLLATPPPTVKGNVGYSTVSTNIATISLSGTVLTRSVQLTLLKYTINFRLDVGLS